MYGCIFDGKNKSVWNRSQAVCVNKGESIRKFLAFVLMLMASGANANLGYSENTDRITKSTSAASIASDNSLQFGFPYKGDNYGRITVRQHLKYGLDVMIATVYGQILCNSYSACPVEIRFDDKPAMRFSGNGPADNSSDTVFSSNALLFISAAKKAKRILVSRNIYKSGAPLLEFSTAAPRQWGNKATEPIRKSATPAKAN